MAAWPSAIFQILRSMTWRHPKVWTPRISGCWRWAVAPLHLLRSGITPVPRIPGQMKTPWACQRPPSPCGNVGEWLMLLKSSAPRSQELTKALERAAVAACCRSFCEQSSDVISVVQLEWPPWNFDIRKIKTVRRGKHTIQIISNYRKCSIWHTDKSGIFQYFPHLVCFWHVESVLAGQDGSGEFASYLDLETWEGFSLRNGKVGHLNGPALYSASYIDFGSTFAIFYQHDSIRKMVDFLPDTCWRVLSMDSSAMTWGHRRGQDESKRSLPLLRPPVETRGFPWKAERGRRAAADWFVGIAREGTLILWIWIWGKGLNSLKHAETVVWVAECVFAG